MVRTSAVALDAAHEAAEEVVGGDAGALRRAEQLLWGGLAGLAPARPDLVAGEIRSRRGGLRERERRRRDRRRRERRLPRGP
jgi:hypothetical protein